MFVQCNKILKAKYNLLTTNLNCYRIIIQFKKTIKARLSVTIKAARHKKKKVDLTSTQHNYRYFFLIIIII